MPRLNVLCVCIAVAALALVPSQSSGGAAALPAVFTIHNTFLDGGDPTHVKSDEWSEEYVDSSLHWGDPCVDAFGGRANTFLAVNWSEADAWNCTPPAPLSVRRFTLSFDGLSDPFDLPFEIGVEVF